MNFRGVFTLIISGFVFTSCATIVGGSKYTANVIVQNQPEATIIYNGMQQGFGVAKIRIPRNNANNVSFLIQREGCEDQTFTYSGRVIRGWALVSSIVFWTGAPPLPIPYGAILDFATGAVYKPDVKEIGITKNNYKSFNYALNYTGCKEKPVEKGDETQEKLVVLKNLFLEGLISAEEYEREKKKILEKL